MMSCFEDERIVINVRGCKFETFKKTLDQFPDTLLGSHNSRTELFDPYRNEIVLDRDKEIFNYVLFYYQSKGILSKPEWTSEGEFHDEVDYFALKSFTVTQEEKTDVLEDELIPVNRFTWIWNLLEKPNSSDAANLLGKFNLCIILISTIMYCMETVKSVRDGRELHFFIMESLFVAWFTVEYLFRVLAAPNRLKFTFSALGMIDLLAIIPYYVTTAINQRATTGGNSLAAIRLVRLIRVCRVLKISRYNKGLRVLAKTLVSSNSQIKSLLLCLIIAVILMSSLVYFTEAFAEEKSNFASIPHTFWFTIVTMTSVGYGDMVPVTILGKVSAVICFLGGIILLLSLPVPVLIAHFKLFYEGGPEDCIRSNRNRHRDLF